MVNFTPVARALAAPLTLREVFTISINEYLPTGSKMLTNDVILATESDFLI